MSIRSRARVRALAVGLGIFVVLVAAGVVLLRLGRPSEPEADPASPPASAPASEARPGDVAEDGRPPRNATQDAPGAASAALAYSSAPQAWLYMTDDEVRAAVAGIATPGAAERLSADAVEEIAGARSELAEAAGPIWWIVHPLAWKVDSFNPAEATVSVWTFSFLSAADVAVPQTEWTTTTFDLEWSQGDWRLAAVRESVGPTPAVGPADQPWEPEPLDEALDGFTRLAGDGVR